MAMIISLTAQAQAGEVQAQLALGQCLLDGRGTARDPAAALGWFTRAAEAGDAMGLNMRGRCLERGWGTEPDLKGAAVCYQAAAARGLDWARYNLANMKLRGRGVPRDVEAAWALFLAAAFQGHAKSMNLVGRFLEEGWGRAPDPVAAAGWYERSARFGDYRGQHNLACLLAARGELGAAFAWWRRALADATPDVLQAMDEALGRIGTGEAIPLARLVRERLVADGQSAASVNPAGSFA